MILKNIAIEKFAPRIHDLWMNQWLVLTAGDYTQKEYNCMVVAWGSLGVMWQKPFAQVVVRPVRYTFEFMEMFDTFTLCGFPLTYHKELNYLGSHSGRNSDKITAAGFTAIASSTVAAPSFAEAELVIECKKMYWQDFDPRHFLNAGIEKNYPKKDYHRVYYGEITAIQVKESKVALYTQQV
jgi:flavin reductase (DIM6/NTAB) family NADH-FMN oxidoreductase RutF